MNIRRVEETDRERYIAMAMDFYHSPAVLSPVPQEHIERTFDEALRSDVYADCFMLENDSGECMGYALTAKTFTQEAGGRVVWLEELYVLPAFQGQGLGSQTIELLERQYAGFQRFRLEVEPENSRARRLYERLGFEELPYMQLMKEGK